MEKDSMTYSVLGLTKKYGNMTVLDNVSFDFKKNHINCILGKSGCGKTTLLNILSGLDRDYISKENSFERIKVSYLFQENRLLPWKNVYQNLVYILKEVYSKAEMEEKIKEVLKIVKLWEYRDYYIDSLSGGMKRRLAIARAFAYPSDCVFLDEPFKELDPQIKEEIIKYFEKLWKRKKYTCLFVTHEIDEAIKLGERIFIMGDRGKNIFQTDQIGKTSSHTKLREKILSFLKK